MTSITSLINKGVYKNSLRRFKWGSFLYFIMLFFSVPFYFMINTPYDLQQRFNLDRISYDNVLFSRGIFVMPMLMAIAVPTVVALLLYNYVHSSKHGIFVHSIPVTRTANLVSGMAAGFTLMLLPVIANAVILYAMTFFGYSKLLSLSSIAYWVLANVFIIFVMFSVATFASFLTGNSFAQVVINALIHMFLPIIAATMALLSDTFLYGYSNSHTSFAELIVEYTPIVWIISTFSDDHKAVNVFSNPAACIYIVIAVAFYVLAMLLYKKRRIENCGEVAAFKVMKPILKYTVTSFGAAAAFYILINTSVHWAADIAVTALVCAIIYFACEMILNKTLKVFHAYKGYFGFVAGCAVVICFCAFTSVFGFETYVPDVSEIETATMYTYYNEIMPVSSEEGSKEAVNKFHKEFIKDIPVFANTYSRNKIMHRESYEYINLEYALKNGKKVDRRYLVSSDLCNSAISEMFAFTDYKRSISGIEILNIDNINNMDMNIELPYFNYSFALNEDAKELLRAIEKDMQTITYDEYNQSSLVNYNLSLSLSPEENDKQKVFKVYENNERYYRHFNFNINSNFKNAIEYLKSKGYVDLAMDRISECMYISKKPVVIEYEKSGDVKYYDDIEKSSLVFEYNGASGEYVKVEKEDALKLLEYTGNNEDKFIDKSDEGYNYIIFVSNSSNGLYRNAEFVRFLSDELPEYLKKYVE